MVNLYFANKDNYSYGKSMFSNGRLELRVAENNRHAWMGVVHR